jgi:hypothetical protein
MKLPSSFPLKKIPRKIKKALNYIETTRDFDCEYKGYRYKKIVYFVNKKGYTNTRSIRKAGTLLSYAFGKKIGHCLLLIPTDTPQEIIQELTKK